METDPVVRKSVGVPNSIWERVKTIQYTRRMKHQADAIRLVILTGLEVLEQQDAKAD